VGTVAARLALRDLDLVMRGLLGDGAPLSPATMLRLKAKWANNALQRASDVGRLASFAWFLPEYFRSGFFESLVSNCRNGVVDCLRNDLPVPEKITVHAIKHFGVSRLSRPLKHPYFFIKQYHPVLIFSVRKFSK